MIWSTQNGSEKLLTVTVQLLAHNDVDGDKLHIVVMFNFENKTQNADDFTIDYISGKEINISRYEQ